jgi:ABC-type bacteriocin/lantibiotic exporter with double-glycine peptidase domain
MDKFKEKKIVNILNIIFVIMFSLFIVSFLLSILNPIFLVGILFIPICFIFSILANTLSDLRKYSIDFINYITNKLNKSSNLEELYDCLNEFKTLAISNGTYNLKYPHDLRKIHEKILSQIEILERLGK